MSQQLGREDLQRSRRWELYQQWKAVALEQLAVVVVVADFDWPIQ
jgi:hypothetical protein